jgi:hypothetical protein
MSEPEQAGEALRLALAMPDVAAMIAEDARENLGGTEVVSVGSVFARQLQGVMCHMVVAIVPDRDGKDFVPRQVILDVTQNYMVASVNRLTLISSLEELFARVQIFGTELALAKYCQKEWPSEEIDQAVAEPTSCSPSCAPTARCSACCDGGGARRAVPPSAPRPCRSPTTTRQVAVRRP